MIEIIIDYPNAQYLQQMMVDQISAVPNIKLRYLKATQILS